ncbi:MAG: retropepsin-like aspartic protease [Bacteroidales bacterium]|jgi:hypothetical protein|nr:retropepsin-like aspartic protease [Bacteroidales bacterium]
MQIFEIPFQLISIEGDGYHILTDGHINGLEAKFLIDTGASRTVFDIEGIRKFVQKPDFMQNERLSTGLGTNEMPSMVVEIESLGFGNLKIEYYPAIAIDLKHVHLSYENLGLPTIDGVLGGDLLARYRCVINYKTRKIKFYI